MVHHIKYLALIAIALASSNVVGATVPASLQLIGGVPSAYVPGSSVSFEVRLPAMSNLGAYNIDVVVEGISGIAGADYFFDRDATQPPPAGYVFPSAANYADGVNSDSPHRQRLTLTDFDPTGVDVTAGENDLAALVVLQTGPGSQFNLTLSIDASSLILDTPAVTPTPVEDFLALREAIGLAEPIRLTAVPEPTGVALLLIGMIAISMAWRRRIAP